MRPTTFRRRSSASRPTNAADFNVIGLGVGDPTVSDAGNEMTSRQAFASFADSVSTGRR